MTRAFRTSPAHLATIAAAALGLVAGLTALAEAQAPPPPPPQPDGGVIKLPELRVTAPSRLPGAPLPRSSVPAWVDVVPGDELRASGATSVLDSLASRVPGLSLSDQQGNRLQPDLTIRGFPVSPVTGIPQGVSVFLDGARINEPGVDEVNFDLIPMDDVDRIEIVRGPFAASGRNTLGASVNIVTARGTEVREIVPEIEAGSFGLQRYRLRLSGTEGRVDYLLSGTVRLEDGWRDVSAARTANVFGKVGLQSGGTDATLSFQHADNRIEQPGSLPVSELRRDRAANFTGGDFFRPRLNLAIFNLRQDVGEQWAIAANAFARFLDAEQFNANLARSNTRSFTTTASAGGTVQVTHDGRVLARRNRLVAGVEYEHHDVRVAVFDETPGRALESDVRDEQHAAAVFAQDTVDVARGIVLAGDALVATVSARWDWLLHAIGDRSPPGDRPRSSGHHAFDRPNPAVGFAYNLSAAHGLYVSYAEGFRAPAFLELTCAGPGAVCPGLQAGVAPDPPLEPVKARNYEIGVRSWPVSWLETDLTLFRTDVRDDIFSVSPTGTVGVFFQNVGDTRREGLEVALRGRWSRVLDAYANYALTSATFRDDVRLATPRVTPGCEASPCTQVVRAGSRLPLVPLHRASVGVDHHVTDWLSASLGASYVGTRSLRGDEANVERPLGDHVVVNAGVTARWKAATAYLWIHNLLDAEYETFGTFAPNAKREGSPIERFVTPAPPINVIAGVRYVF